MQRLPPALARRGAALAAATVATLAAGPARAGQGEVVFHLTRHGNSTSGVNRLSTVAVGHCMQCHPTRATAPFAQAHILFAPNDNALCSTCHSAAGAAGVYQGPTAFNTSLHWTSGRLQWPGPTPPARPAGDEGKCLNCHTPHGTKDAAGLVPDQAIAREQALCPVIGAFGRRERP